MGRASLQGLALAAACFFILLAGHVHLAVAVVVAVLVWLMYVSHGTQ